jgi:hypothetical protein
MKWLLIMFLLGFTVFEVEKKMNHENRGVYHSKTFSSFAVLELFTSEGCSSCPPADRLLPQLAGDNANIIPLSFHVDYWDRLGWKDPFSNAAFTDRQREYAKQFKLESIYTPQLVINGEYETVGSNRAAAQTDIKKLLLQKSEVQLVIDDVKQEKENLFVKCHLSGAFQNCNVLAAVVQKHAEINVNAGENHGARLSHTNVVRTFVKIPAQEKLSFQIPVSIDKDNNNSSAGKQGWQLVIYTQQKDDLKITGATVYSP